MNVGKFSLRKTFPWTTATVRLLFTGVMLRVWLSLVVLLALVVVAIHVEGVLFRRKVERLLADVVALDPKTAAYADFRALLTKYRDDAILHRPCSPKTCSFEVRLIRGEIIYEGYRIGESAGLLWTRALLALGLRPANVKAQFGSHESKFVSKSFSVQLHHFPNPALLVDGAIVPNFTWQRQNRTSHSKNVRFRGGSCKINCELLFTMVTADASPEELSLPFNFNLNCFSRISDCSLAEFVPDAYRAWESSTNQPDTTSCSPEDLEVEARDSYGLFVGRVMTRKRTEDGVVVQLFPVEVLKGKGWEFEGKTELSFHKDLEIRTLADESEVIVLLDPVQWFHLKRSRTLGERYPHLRSLDPWSGSCAVVPAKEEFRNAAKSGIARDRCPECRYRPPAVVRGIRQPLPAKLQCTPNEFPCHEYSLYAFGDLY